MRSWPRNGCTPVCCLRWTALPPARPRTSPTKNILALQGPFSYALNRALLEQFSIRFLVTKDGGAAGGFAEKAQAAADTGVQLIVIRRPAETVRRQTRS